MRQIIRPSFVRRFIPIVLGIETEVEIGVDEGLKHHSCIRCDELFSVHKSVLTNYVDKLSAAKLGQLNSALKIALVIE